MKGLIKSIHNGQISHSKDRGHVKPEYTLKELNDWILSKPNFKSLYSDWVKSNYNKGLRPSIDRKDNNIGYSFDNIELTTWNINNQRGYDARRLWSNKCLPM